MNSANNNEALVRAFFDTWSVSFESMIEGFQRFVADDCLLIQTRTPDLHGLGEIIPFLKHVRHAGLMEKMEVEVVNVVATESSVAAERIDVMHMPNGTIGARFPCVSVMEVNGDKITGWRDYFDSADMPSGGIAIVNDSN